MRDDCLTYYQKLVSEHQIRIILQDKPVLDHLFPVILEVDHQSWKILTNDVYGDLSPVKPKMTLYLIFRALADFRNSSDYLAWCNYLGLETNHPGRLDYYRSLHKIVQELSDILGNIEPCISDLDYDLQSGEYYSLLEAEKD